ncbi:glycerate kinase [Carboxylicivirga sp. N1Y90]|uniref:glycerate kinase n=1 Tax=Carboxylicivirga fragile TaxID=3417571 RepID=UPI003D3346F6|nr:glycerate kinase [Marinilabiliaceae bacterium N1Y90]
MKNVFICCDSYKGTLSSKQVNDIIYQELSTEGDYSFITKELADGGEGSLSIIKQVTSKVEEIHVPAYNPVGNIIQASYLRNERIAYIEVAVATGISLLSKSEKDPLKLNSYGTGQQILHAIKNGCTEIHLFLGGSATVDGGTGILSALSEIPFSNTNQLLDFSVFDLNNVTSLLRHVQFQLICDVKNTPTGNNGAVRVFGPQKGANKVAIELLESQMIKWINHLTSSSGIKLSEHEGLGAAGAIGLPIVALADTKIKTGFSYFNELMHYQNNIEWCDVLITGEGCIDEQTIMGKGPGKLAKLAYKRNKKVIGIGGIVKCKPAYFDVVFSTIGTNNTTHDLLNNAEKRLVNVLPHIKDYINKIIP